MKVVGLIAVVPWATCRPAMLPVGSRADDLMFPRSLIRASLTVLSAVNAEKPAGNVKSRTTFVLRPSGRSTWPWSRVMSPIVTLALVTGAAALMRVVPLASPLMKNAVEIAGTLRGSLALK